LRQKIPENYYALLIFEVHEIPLFVPVIESSAKVQAILDKSLTDKFDERFFFGLHCLSTIPNWGGLSQKLVHNLVHTHLTLPPNS
jgi:hypothetical protein